jgi:hypothetical protein
MAGAVALFDVLICLPLVLVSSVMEYRSLRADLNLPAEGLFLVHLVEHLGGKSTNLAVSQT